jgi:DNA-binding NarL/FixJ family response regulator
MIELARPRLDAMGQLMYLGHLAATEVHIRVARGDLDGAAAVTAPGGLTPRYAALWGEGQARLLAGTGRVEEALHVVDAALSGLSKPATVAVLGLTTTAAIACRAGDRPGAVVRLDEARAWATKDLPLTELLLALAAAEVEDDVAAAVRAMDLAAHQPFELAQAQLHAGRLGLDPAVHLNEAFRTFQALGADPWIQRAQVALRERRLPIPRSTRRAPGDLTAAERSVAELVAAGLRNREIAERLSYSTRTVETYLSRIYDKIGVRTRVALARRLEHGGEP